MATEVEDPAVTVFREYLRIKTVQPNPDYESAILFLEKIAQDLDLPFKCVKGESGNIAAVVITWEGQDPSLPSIILNSHMDVVPVFPEHWTYEPFSAHKTENGDIYARGTQDMKCVGMQYIEAIRKLRAQGVTLLRTIHVTFVPDEEIGGGTGMKQFVKTDDFKAMNLGFALDEGLANPTDSFTIFYGERSVWWLKVTCKGPPGHGSRFIESTAAEKMSKIVQSFTAFREDQKKRLNSNADLRLGDVTTVNWTIAEGGVQPNVVPSEMSSVFDIRITPTMDLEEFENKIKQWCKEAGEDVTYEFLSVGHCNHYNLKQLNFGEKELVLESCLLRTCSGHGESSQRLFPLPCPSFYCFISVTVACFSPFRMGTHGWVARIRQLWERSTSTCRSWLLMVEGRPWMSQASNLHFSYEAVELQCSTNANHYCWVSCDLAKFLLETCLLLLLLFFFSKIKKVRARIIIFR